MTLKKIILPVLLLLCQLVLAQNDSILLPEVVITDTQLKDFSATQSVQRLSDSIISRNGASLTSLLNYNTVIYFKENGLGMVSSPSFRGTTAQQTAVIWNGININSQLNGQTDFNLLNIRDFSSISIRAGGGSVIYGSSAIGGSIHLNNELAYNDSFINEIRVNYGSFNTFGTHYMAKVASDRFSFSISATRNSSDNDYDYVNSEEKNLNGQYYNTSMNAVAGFRINDKNTLTLYSYLFDGERHFSLIFPSEVKTKYRDTNTRNMLEWMGLYGKFASKLKVAFLEENYKYYGNIEDDSFSYGKTESLIGKYDLLFRIKSNIKLNAVVDYTQTKGMGSDLESETRHIGSGSLLFSHNVTNKFMYEAGARKEVTNNYDSPFLFSLGTKYKVADFYAVKLNTSKNFRIPTFNDLYWSGSGNVNLKPETSWQAELGNDFIVKDLTLTLTGYYTKIKDMLRWLPAGSVWRPVNTDKVKTYGLEAILAYNKQFGTHNLTLNGTYGYTKSEDETTGKQLIYVPYHKATASLAYEIKKLMAYYQFLYNGEVFTRTDNNSKYNIDAYTTGNIGAEYNFGKKNTYRLGVQALNVWNENYQTVDGRYMPGRNYNMYLTLKF